MSQELRSVISIVTPSYNHGRYLGECIDSILSQEGEFLIDSIIVDGGSTDGSADLIRRIAREVQESPRSAMIGDLPFYQLKGRKNSGISFRFFHEQDDGHADALRKGFAISVGSTMAWLNSDDKYFQGAFHKVQSIFAELPDVKWLVGKNAWWDRDGDLIGSRMVYKNVYDYLTFNYEWIQQESVFWRRELWDRAGAHVDVSKRLMVDGELWARFFELETLHHVDTELSGYRFTASNRANHLRSEVDQEMIAICSDLNRRLAGSFAYPNDFSRISNTGTGWKTVRLERGEVKELAVDEYAAVVNSLEYRIGSRIVSFLKTLKKMVRVFPGR